MQCIHNQVKPLLLNKAKTFSPQKKKKKKHFWFTDIFPNINRLLRIACTIPVTSADNEQEKSTALKLVKGYLRTTMTTERLSGLAE